jgi:alpha-ketoglutarate-dependent 2,4-dichlorophenoxyacetate dioxygenase
MITLRELHRDFAAEVAGVDMREPPSDALRGAVEDAIDRYPVLVLRDQDLTDQQHIAFVEPFGELQQSTEYRTQKGEHRLPGLMTDASNIGKDNQTFGAGDARRMSNLGSRRWHTDGSFRPRPVKYSLLAARSVVREGGETQFADMRNAYDALPAELKERIDDLVIEHSLLHSRRVAGFLAEPTELERLKLASVHQRLVRRHPKTGRRSLYLSSHASHVVGWPLPEGLDLLYELTDRATQPAFVYTHAWRLYDVVMWDNRVTMHRARRHTPETDPRDMRRVSVLDDTNTLEQTA